MFVLKRSQHNPILAPLKNHHWEASATFNMSVTKKDDKIYGFYRAISSEDKLRTPSHISTIGMASSKDGIHFEERKQFIEPVEDWEKFGCEDPRVTFFEGKYYIFYTALSVYPFAPEGIRVAVAVSDKLEKVDERHRVTTFNSKAMTLFPSRINDKITVLFSAHTDGAHSKLSLAQVDRMSELWKPEFWEKWYHEMDDHVIRLNRNDYDHIEVGAPPLRTKHGWLVIYSHIENFFPSPNGGPKFGIEAVLLDLDDPKKILGRTDGPMMVPEEAYEFYGQVPNITFPSGASIDGDTLSIYYGAADTTSCVARVSLEDLLSTIMPKTRDKWRLKRGEKNPILLAEPNHAWESKAVFNPAAIELEGKIYILYRALSGDNTSTIGLAITEDGLNITERLPDPIYVPREDFENKKIENGNSGCEDPRVTRIGDVLYMCYTAFDGIGPPRVAISTIEVKDFLDRKWDKWSKPLIITPQGVDDKDTCILDEKVDGKYMIMHRIGTDICADYLHSLNFEKEVVTKCIRVMGPRQGMWDGLKIGIAGPPIKSKAGWILLYHAVSEVHHWYRIGAVLLDEKDPTIVLSRSTDVIFEPQEKYEKEGIVPNVVFPCGMVSKNGTLYVYYGGADQVLGVATIELEVLEKALTRHVGESF
jgi:beta-1,2-mannobiose phosphorylase / 1,2-beta-oligomannan phosphorylase